MATGIPWRSITASTGILLHLKRPQQMAIKVIVVDDEPAAIDVLKYHIDMTPSLTLLATFSDGRQAMQYCLQHDVNLMFCDIEMPLMNGLEVAERQLGN